MTTIFGARRVDHSSKALEAFYNDQTNTRTRTGHDSLTSLRRFRKIGCRNMGSVVRIYNVG